MRALVVELFAKVGETSLLGGICQGTMLTIADTILIAGMWTIPPPLETKTVGAIVSITSGI